MRKILCIVLAFAICSFCVFPYVHAEDTATDLQTQREELQNQLNDANEQLDGVQSQKIYNKFKNWMKKYLLHNKN